MKPKIMAVCGTRPDAIKMAPVVHELRARNDMDTRLVVSGQHRQMLAQALAEFELSPDIDFDVMKPQQSLCYVTAAILEGLDETIAAETPDMIVAQGDTTTTFVASLAAFYRQIPFAHVEAGLRTSSIKSPFPEEFNRRTTGQIAEMHFTPTRVAKANLLGEGVPVEKVVVSGNTSIDAILEVTRESLPFIPLAEGRMLLLTTHRRENWGEPQRSIARAVRRIVKDHPDVFFVVPMHKNERVRETLVGELGGIDSVFLVEPPGYKEFGQWMKASHFILTDSGGIQEEAPALGKPVLVLRNETERPEGLAAGSAILVGTDESKIARAASNLLTSELAYSSMANVVNPYGDGLASKRIAAAIAKYFDLAHNSIPEFVG